MIRENNLSYGLRIKPGEVHARDSTCVLIESGSNDNRFLDNDCTHGGDGVFIRVLNGWVSTGNVFERQRRLLRPQQLLRGLVAAQHLSRQQGQSRQLRLLAGGLGSDRA